jgi:membrane peptidoglycan carboxypeptidase
MPAAQTVHTILNQRRRRAMRYRRTPSARAGRLGLGLGMVAVLLIAGLFLWLGLAYADLTRDLPSLQTLAVKLDPHTGVWLQPTRLYDRSGTHLLKTLEAPGAPRQYLSLDATQTDHIPDSLVKVTLATFDPTFWSNPGYVFTGLWSGEHPTLAEQLVSDLLIEDETPGLRRNLRERLLAAQLVQTYGRDQVLEWYLNSAAYGKLAYGAESAARLYFGKPASQLSLAEAAVLVAAQRAPALNPLDAPAAAIQAQREIVGRMYEQGSITADEARNALVEPMVFKTPAAAQNEPAPAFVELALEQLGSVYSQRQIEQGGWVVITSLDYDLQKQALCATQTHLLRLQGNPKVVQTQDGAACKAALLLPTLSPEARDLPNELSAAVEVLDPQTGQVLALTGEIRPNGVQSPSNSHEPGSLLTPLIYLAGYARGFGPGSLAWDIPANAAALPADLQTVDGRYHGPVRMRVALANDYLGPAYQLLQQITPDSVWRQAQTFGLPYDPGGANAEFPGIGTKISLTQAVQAFGVFANQGILAGQTWGSPQKSLRSSTILRVESASGSLAQDWNTPVTQSVSSPQLAYLVNSVLSDEPARWASLGNPNPLEIGRPAGAKLGRTSSANAWTVGYTPQRVIGVWLGAPAGTTWQGQIDPLLSADLWHGLAQWSLRDASPAGWDMPVGISTVDVCDPSGELPSADCPAVVSEYFLNGSEPTQVDDLYQSVQVNRETGRLATVFTPADQIEQRVVMNVPSDALDWARSSGQAIAPTDYDLLQAPAVLADAHISAPAMFSAVRGKLTLTGTAAGQGFVSYTVQVGQGINPQEWVQIGPNTTTPVEEGKLAEWDTQGKSGLYAVRLMVVRANQRVDIATLQLTVDNQAPNVKIVFPKNGTALKYPDEAQMTLQAQAADDTGVTRVVWSVGGSVVGEEDAAQFDLAWRPDAPGKYVLTARAYDRAGNVGESAPVSIRFDR